MTSEQVLFCLTERCKVYFEGALISKELIIREYARFFSSAVSAEGRSVSIALHTGSICFSIVAFLAAALGSLLLDKTDPDSIIASLNEGDMVIFSDERYRWRGEENLGNERYVCLEQDGRGRNGKSKRFLPYDANKSFITPYYGNSEMTDGRGIRHNLNNRSDFISYFFGVSGIEASKVTGISTVIVTERDTFDRISKGTTIVYKEGKSIGLLDIVTASYFSDSGEEYQFGNNPAKADPILKIAGKISTARDLVLDKRGNRTVGLLIIGSSNILKNHSELLDLLCRQSLQFVHIAASIDCDYAMELIETQQEAKVFACTKEFLLQNSLPPKERNVLTVQLDKQIDNIVNNSVSTFVVSGGCSWEELKQVREDLYFIKTTDWDEETKNKFLITAYALLNLLLTAVFPLEVLDRAVEEGELTTGVASPSARLQMLWELTNQEGVAKERCRYVVNILDKLYTESFFECHKFEALWQRLIDTKEQKIAIIVPKAYYIDMLISEGISKDIGITIVTANRFDNSKQYDEIIAVGDIIGKRFDPLKCRAASDITVLLYECETYLFKHKKRKAGSFENKLNSRVGIAEESGFDPDTAGAYDDSDIDDKDMNGFAVMADLERYIEQISVFDVGRFAGRASALSGVTLTSDVIAVGQFVSGEQILFTKYYNAVVFDAPKGTVVETNIEELVQGDLLIFVKHDDYTYNMVDFIYDRLLSSGRLRTEVVEATKKAVYWKKVLREYKRLCGFSYRDVAKELRKFGSSLREATIRQWLIEKSHIVGPRDKKTLEQIAELTQDKHLLNDTNGYFEACRTVRHQRKEILRLIGKAITDKLSGRRVTDGSVFEVVYSNVDSLSEMLELENIALLNESVTVPINVINKPISDWEVVA